MKFTIPHYIALIVSLFKRVPKHLKFRAVTFSKDWSWSPVFKRHFKWFKLWSCWVRGAIAYSTRVNFLPSTTLLRAKLDAEILFWPDPCECGCCENSNADGNLTPWSVYRNFWMMRLWSCFVADEVFLVSQARGGHALCTAKHQHFLSKPENLVSSFGIRKYLVSFTKLWAAQLQSGCWGKKDVNPRSSKCFANWRSNL